MTRKYVTTTLRCLAVAAIILPATAAAQTTTRLTATKANDYGIVYSLPRTALDIELQARKTVRTPGKFYKYARKYLNIDNPLSEPQTRVELISADIVPAGVPDPDERYVVTFKSGTAPYMILSADNIPLSVNTDLAAPVTRAEVPESTPAAPVPMDTPAGRQAITLEISQSQSLAKGAELAAAQIFALRESRNELITGNADTMPPDGASLQILLDNLEAQETALMSLFIGTEQVSTFGTVVRVEPDDEDISRQVIARISAADGFVAPDNMAGMPVYLNLEITEHGELPVSEKGVPLPFPKNGLAYRIPGQATVTVTADGRTYAERSIPLAQAGMVYGLNANSFTDKKAPIYIILDPTTGALLEQGPAQPEYKQ